MAIPIQNSDLIEGCEIAWRQPKHVLVQPQRLPINGNASVLRVRPFARVRPERVHTFFADTGRACPNTDDLCTALGKQTSKQHHALPHWENLCHITTLCAPPCPAMPRPDMLRIRGQGALICRRRRRVALLQICDRHQCDSARREITVHLTCPLHSSTHLRSLLTQARAADLA